MPSNLSQQDSDVKVGKWFTYQFLRKQHTVKDYLIERDAILEPLIVCTESADLAHFTTFNLHFQNLIQSKNAHIWKTIIIDQLILLLDNRTMLHFLSLQCC